jgi:hypothetical protein
MLMPTSPAPSAASSAARVIGLLAFVYGLASSFAVFGALVVTISMATQNSQGGQGGGALTLPVAPSSATAIPEALLPPLEIAGLPIGSGYFTQLELTGAGLSLGTELMYFAPLVLTPLLHAIVAFGIASLATRIEKNEGFAPQLTRAAIIVGVSLIVIGSLSQALHFFGESLARHELFGSTELGGWVAPGPADITHLAAGLAVLLLGVLMQRGVQLERDTDGLV